MKYTQQLLIYTGKISAVLFTMQVPVPHIDGLVQERHNSSALAMELRLSCINPSTYDSQTFESWA